MSTKATGKIRQKITQSELDAMHEQHSRSLKAAGEAVIKVIQEQDAKRAKAEHQAYEQAVSKQQAEQAKRDEVYQSGLASNRRFIESLKTSQNHDSATSTSSAELPK